MQDNSGRKYLKLAEARQGMWVNLDKGFTCRTPGAVLLRCDKGGMFFLCDHGQHYIKGQADDNIHCIGIYPRLTMEIPTMPNEIEKCQRCRIAIACPKHICPYKQDINDDSETLCNCCEECKEQCADDI